LARAHFQEAIMLTPTFARGDHSAAVDSIHNYYEHLVLGEIRRQLQAQPHDADFVADVACVALNHLPPRYVRHDVDMAFYLSPKESLEMEDKVRAAVDAALQFVQQRGRRDL